MKNSLLRLLSVALLALLLAGCEKALTEEDAGRDASGANVFLKFTAYEQVPFGTRSVQDITALCSRLNIAFFQNGTKVKTVSQKEEDESFGNVALTLEEGDYQIVVIAHNCDGSATITSEQKVTFPSNIVTDTFYYYGDLTVGSSANTYSLQLTRCVAMFRLELTSPLPDSAAKMRFYYTGGSSTFSPLEGYGCVNSRQTVMMGVTSDQTVFEVYTMPHDESGVLKMTVTVYDANDNIVKEHVFEQVPVTRDKITVYTGDFMDGNASSGHSFYFTAEGQWGGTNSYTF